MFSKSITKYLSEPELRIIAHKISAIEKETSGEIRVCIKEKRGFLERKLEVRKLAERQFFDLKMDKTRDKTGVLVYILFNEHKFEILADSGINEKIDNSKWEKIKSVMVSDFKNEEYHKGIIFAIEQIGSILKIHFPSKHDDKDELENEVIIR